MSSLVMILVFLGAAYVLRVVLPLGTALSYGAQFLCAATVLGVGITVSTYLERPRRERS